MVETGWNIGDKRGNLLKNYSTALGWSGEAFVEYIGMNLLASVNNSRIMNIGIINKSSAYKIKTFTNLGNLRDKYTGITYNGKNIICLAIPFASPAHPRLRWYDFKGNLLKDIATTDFADKSLKGLCFDGKHLYTINSSDNNISQIKIDTGKLLKTYAISGANQGDLTYDKKSFWVTYVGAPSSAQQYIKQYNVKSITLSNNATSICTNGKNFIIGIV